MAFDLLGIISPHPPIMVPEVGGERTSATSASTEAMAEAARLMEGFAPDTIVLMTPHAVAARDAFAIETAQRTSGHLGDFGAPNVRASFVGDPELAYAIMQEADEIDVATVDRQSIPDLDSGWLDHAATVPLYFLDPAASHRLVVLSLSWLPYADHRALGACVVRAARLLDRRIAFVASGDCSHRLTRESPAGYSPRGRLFDTTVVELVSRGDFEGLAGMEPSLVSAAGECGLRSFVTLGGALGEIEDVVTRVLCYEGPWGIGYLTAIAAGRTTLSALGGLEKGRRPMPDDVGRNLGDTPPTGDKGGGTGKHESAPVALARAAIEAHVGRGQTLPSPSLDDPSLPARAGAFVSLHRGGALRGCIGTICATCETLAEEIARNAVKASVEDPRFPPLEAEELADLDIKVDVLHDAEECAFADLDPERYGVIVSCGWRRGLLLPDLEGVDTADKQVDIAMRKAGISQDEPVRLERFRVDRHT